MGDWHIGDVVYEGSTLHDGTTALRLRLDGSRLEADGSWQTVPSLYLLLSQDMTQVLGTADSADYLTEEERALIPGLLCRQLRPGLSARGGQFLALRPEPTVHHHHPIRGQYPPV